MAKIVKVVQIGLDIAIPEGLSSSDAETFIADKVTSFISNESPFEVLNGVICSEDLTSDYDLNDLND